MLKFKFDYLHNLLAYWKEGDTRCQIAEERKLKGNFDDRGFKFYSGYITFTIHESKIRAFYKHIESPNWFTYYRKDLPKDCPVIFEFTESDRIEKLNGKWRRQHE